MYKPAVKTHHPASTCPASCKAATVCKMHQGISWLPLYAFCLGLDVLVCVHDPLVAILEFVSQQHGRAW